MKKARVLGGLAGDGGREKARLGAGWVYTRGMIEYLDQLIERSGIDPIMLGWILSVCVLLIINHLRGRK